MKKSWIILYATLLISLMLVSCAPKDKYSMARDVIQEQVTILENYIADMEKADNASAVAQAINRYSEAQSKLGPAIKKVQEQFPEMKQEAEPPIELKPELDKLNAVMAKMFEMTRKAAGFMNDDAVMEAQKNLQNAMNAMR